MKSSSKKVPVTINVAGQRKKIGEAFVEMDNDLVSVTAKIQQEYLPDSLLDLQNISLGPLTNNKE